LVLFAGSHAQLDAAADGVDAHTWVSERSFSLGMPLSGAANLPVPHKPNEAHHRASGLWRHCLGQAAHKRLSRSVLICALRLPAQLSNLCYIRFFSFHTVPL
jgi:hypothetical protein